MSAAPSPKRYRRRALVVIAVAALAGAVWTVEVLPGMVRTVRPLATTELSIGDMLFAVPPYAQRYTKADAKTIVFNLYQERDLAPLVRCWRVNLLVEAEPVTIRQNRRPIADPFLHPALAAFNIPAGTAVSATDPPSDIFDFNVPGAIIKGRPVTVTCSTRRWQLPSGRLSGHFCGVDQALTDDVTLRIGFHDSVVPLSSWPKLFETAENVLAKYTIAGEWSPGAAAGRDIAGSEPQRPREPALECPRS